MRISGIESLSDWPYKECLKCRKVIPKKCEKQTSAKSDVEINIQNYNFNEF